MRKDAFTYWPLRHLTLRLLMLSLVLAAAGAAFRGSVQAGSEESAAKDARVAFQAKNASSYSYKFGGNSPFLPSNATTDTGQFLQSSAFPTAEYCGHCHQASQAQWRQSAHSNSNRPVWY